MSPLLERLFCQHIAASFDKQMHLGDLVGDRSWRFNMHQGLLSFGDDLQWQIQILGTESEGSQTWLWAWANEASGIPSNLLQAAQAIRELGERNGIQELIDAEVPLSQADGHSLAAIATGVLDSHAYYRGPYEGGAVFLLITDSSFRRASENPPLRIASNFCQVISSYPIASHREAFQAYLRYYALPSRADGSEIVVEQDGTALLTAKFDRLDRLAKLESTVSPNTSGQPSQKKPWWKRW
jgi:hypothetical protein